MNAVGIGLLVVSSISLVVQVSSLARLLLQPPTKNSDQRLANKGLIRTSITRVLASVLYVLVAVNSIYNPEETYFALIIFTIVQVMWQANALADVSLRRHLSHLPKKRKRGRHRR